MDDTGAVRNSLWSLKRIVGPGMVAGAALLDIRVRRVWAIRTFGVAQFAKYVPGNVIHLASRQALGLRMG